MSILPINFKLQEETINLISQRTKLTPSELRSVPLAETKRLMIERGAIKKPNLIVKTLKNLYIGLGEKLGFIEKERYSFFDGD